MTEVLQGYEICPDWAPIFGYMGAASCMILSSWGSAWGTWRAGLGVCHMGIDHPAGIIKNVVPIVMAGVLGIYGLIVAVIITQAITPPNGANANMTSYSSYNGYTHFAAGLCCGLSCLAAGGTIGVLGDAGVRAFGIKAESGRKWYWNSDVGGGGGDEGGGDFSSGRSGGMNATEGSNKLYVGMLIMLIFSEALALYGLIVALILSQHSYTCGAK